MTASGRDYSLTGSENASAIAKGLANAQWYQTPLPRQHLKELMKRSDAPATRDTALWLGGMLLTAALGIFFWGSWLAVPFFLIYGVLYGSGGDSRWHECAHGSAFKTPWKNEAVYQLACFMMMRNPVAWKWSHSRHHTDTIIVGRDYEIVARRPPALGTILLNFFGIIDVPQAFSRMLLHARGHLTAEEQTFVPASEFPKVYRVARIWLGIYALVLVAAVWSQSLLPLVLIGLPRMYGAWHHLLTGLIQHAGLAEDVLDHRLNSRTCYLNPFSRFVYWNMNYHLEHHMYPLVPYYRLPELHAAIKQDAPPPYSGIVAAYREIIPTLLRQRREPDYYVRRDLPNSAQNA